MQIDKRRPEQVLLQPHISNKQLIGAALWISLRGLLVGLLVVVAIALAAAPASARYAAIIVDADSGRVLHEKNADTRNYPASLTKMMTLYLLFEALDGGRLTLDDALRVSNRAARRPASRLGLKAGETITVRDAILALVTKSANDVATVVAEALAGSERAFARSMTEKARALGMARTSFRNASGLPHRRQLSSARDMAVLAQALHHDYPDYYSYFATATFAFRGRTYRNHNKLLTGYPGTDGLKTGYIRASGYNLAASVERDGRRLVGVVFGGRSPSWRNRHMIRLFDRAFRLIEAERRGDERGAAIAATDAPAAEQVSSRERPTETSPSVAVGDAEPAPTEWGIQVGAFRREAAARRVASEAQQAAVALLDGTRIVIPPIEARSGRFFRARLVGLSRKDAFRACRRLKARRFDCLPIPPNQLTTLAQSYLKS
jgi:D-alanyl-D-alanine carboxypeptidase